MRKKNRQSPSHPNTPIIYASIDLPDRFTQICEALTAILTQLNTLSKSAIITNLNTTTFNSNRYYILWYRNGKLTLKKVTPNRKSTLILNFNTASLTPTDMNPGDANVETISNQLMAIANDLQHNRARLLSKKGQKIYG